MHITWSRFCTVNCWALVSNCQLSHVGSNSGFAPHTSEVGGECVIHNTTDPLIRGQGLVSQSLLKVKVA